MGVGFGVLFSGLDVGEFDGFGVFFSGLPVGYFEGRLDGLAVEGGLVGGLLGFLNGLVIWFKRKNY
jgi:hypothetical protein